MKQASEDLDDYIAIYTNPDETTLNRYNAGSEIIYKSKDPTKAIDVFLQVITTDQNTKMLINAGVLLNDFRIIGALTDPNNERYVYPYALITRKLSAFMIR
ncbi:MAG: hypothetical protein WCJ33_08785, partial [Pseudomonadota bacterium]